MKSQKMLVEKKKELDRAIIPDNEKELPIRNVPTNITI
jgi:hypothetical protein